MTQAADGVWVFDGVCNFCSGSVRLASLDAPGEFEERLGPLRFRFSPRLRRDGFAWRFESWRLLGVRLPKALAPKIRAVSFARDGIYRFRVLTAHPWLGVVFAYCGRLDG